MSSCDAAGRRRVPAVHDETVVGQIAEDVASASDLAHLVDAVVQRSAGRGARGARSRAIADDRLGIVGHRPAYGHLATRRAAAAARCRRSPGAGRRRAPSRAAVDRRASPDRAPTRRHRARPRARARACISSEPTPRPRCSGATTTPAIPAIGRLRPPHHCRMCSARAYATTRSPSCDHQSTRRCRDQLLLDVVPAGGGQPRRTAPNDRGPHVKQPVEVVGGEVADGRAMT